jgi:hypothetical protein
MSLLRVHRVPQKAGNFLTSGTTIGFSGRSLLHVELIGSLYRLNHSLFGQVLHFILLNPYIFLNSLFPNTFNLCSFLITRGYTSYKFRTVKIIVSQWYSAGLRAGWSGARVPAGAGNFSLHHRVQTGSQAHPASYPVGIRDSYPGGKAATLWSWPLTSI